MSESGLPGDRRHRCFPQMWQLGREKFVAVSVCTEAVKGPKPQKCGRRKLFCKSLVKPKDNMTPALPDVYRRGHFTQRFPIFKT
jgi:hypothetical protein